MCAGHVLPVLQAMSCEHAECQTPTIRSLYARHTRTNKPERSCDKMQRLRQKRHISMTAHKIFHAQMCHNIIFLEAIAW